MDFKKINAPQTTPTREMNDLWEEVGNVYETIAIIAKRANQINLEIKKELDSKLSEFNQATPDTGVEEVFENKEQIEVSRYYERLPKPTLLATQEFMDGKVFHRNPIKEKRNL